MKGKTILSLAIVLSMLFAALPLVSVKAVEQVKVEVMFENGKEEITKAPCTNFVVSINITLPAGVVIDFWDMEIRWDTTTLELQHGTAADVAEGGFMLPFGETDFGLQDPDNVNGILPDISNGFKSGGNAAGSGVLCTIKFHCKAVGDGWIDIYLPNDESYLLDQVGTEYNLVSIDVTTNGIVHQPPEAAKSPTADINAPADGSIVPVCNDVLLDGSTSTGGVDSVPTGEPCPIEDWMWMIDFHNGTFLELHGETTSFHCDGEGMVTITLTVYAPDPTPSPPELPEHDYDPYDSHVHTIIQQAPSLGPADDVYTDKGGEGHFGDFPYPYAWSDAYGPQELVTVYCKLTYNEEPVEYKPNAFEMIDPNGVSRDYRVAFTGPDGIATVTFRIPWEGSNAKDLFGVWTIISTADIAGVIVTDIVKFKFGYLLFFNSVTVSYTAPLKKGEYMTIDVDIESISFTSHDARLTIVACDAAGVPIGLADGVLLGWIAVDSEGSNVFSGFTVTIPTWAFVGTGHIYANLFTDFPHNGGVAYCPEDGTAIFILSKT
jgi:hypothetical protein